MIRNLRSGIPPDPEPISPLDQLREFSQWLLVVPLVMVILFGCGQIALLGSPEIAYANTRSALNAEYGPWPYLSIYEVRSEIVSDIQSDRASDSDQTFQDPVDLESVWLEEQLPTEVVVASAPTEGAPEGNSPNPTNVPGGSPPSQTPLGGTPEDTPVSGSPGLPTATSATGSTSGPGPTSGPSSTSGPGPTSTPYTDATFTSTSPPGPTNTSVPGSTATSTPQPTSTPVPSPTDPPPTATKTATPYPTSTSPPPQDYCANIQWTDVSVTDYEGRGTVIKFLLGFKNKNSISASLTSYSVSWTDSGLSLHRTGTILGDGSRPRIIGSHGSSPASCEHCPVSFVPNPPFQQEIYNMYCVNRSCDEESASEPPIAPGTYNFSASGTFNINGVNCNFNKSGSITMH